MTNPQNGLSFFDYLSIAAIVISILGVVWNAHHYLRGLVVNSRGTECFPIDEHRCLVVFRFSIWNPSSQTKTIERIGTEYDFRFALFGKWTEPQRWRDKEDSEKLVLADEKGVKVGESRCDEFFEFVLNIEPHHTQGTSLPLILEIQDEDILRKLLNERLSFWICLYSPKMKRIARYQVGKTLRELLTPVISPTDNSFR